MDKDFIKAVETVLATGARVQLKQMKDGSIKVADFGIACLENEGQTLLRQTFDHN